MAFVEAQKHPHAERWVIRRPERGNSLGLTVAAELLRLLTALERRPELPAALVLTAEPLVNAGRRTWIAGGDLKELAELEGPSAAHAYAMSLSTFMTRLDALPIPVVVAIDGAAIGGGAELALAGDLRLATQASHLEFRQLKVGLATGYGGARRLVELAGLARAQTLLFGCSKVAAGDALAWGLLHRVEADAEGLERAVQELCAELAGLEPRALAAQKRMLWHATRSHPGAAREAELRLFADLWGNPTHERTLARYRKKETRVDER